MCYKAIDLVENIAYRCANRTEKGEDKMVGASRLFIETGPHKPLVVGSNPSAATINVSKRLLTMSNHLKSKAKLGYS